MSRISELFLDVRDTLNDHLKQRWSDETLFRQLRKAIQDIAKKTELFKEITVIPLIPGTAVYKCPDGIITLNHATYNRLAVPLRSHEWMNKNLHSFWRQDTVEISNGQILYGVYDEVHRKQIRAYPIPIGDTVEEYVSQPNEYGLVGDVETFINATQYGILENIIDTDFAPPVQTSLYGVATLIGEGAGLTIYYTRTPPLPYELDDVIELDEMFDPAIKYFICGTVLRNDLDVANRNIASEEFKLYDRELDTIEELAHTDSVSAQWFRSHYNPMG